MSLFSELLRPNLNDRDERSTRHRHRGGQPRSLVLWFYIARGITVIRERSAAQDMLLFFWKRYGFQSVQKYYAVFGACFMPFLAILLIYLNGRASAIGAQHKNRSLTNMVLAGIVVLFLLSMFFMAREKFDL